MKTKLKVYEWTSVDDNLPEHTDPVLIWRWDMPFVGYYDIQHSWWVIDGVSGVSGVEFWKDVQRP